MRAQLGFDPEPTQQSYVEVLTVVEEGGAWQGPGLGLPEPHVAGKKMSFWNNHVKGTQDINCLTVGFSFIEMKSLDPRKPVAKMAALGPGQMGEGW